MGLFGPAWMSKKPRDARKAVDEISEITSQDKLAKAARRRRWKRCARRLYLDHRDFPAKYGLKEKAEADYARCEVELEKYKRQMEENMDRIPMDY